jgi:hypothetical protein
VIPVGEARTIVVRPRVSGWYKLLLGLSLGLNVLVLMLLLTVGANSYRYYRALAGEVGELAEGSPAADRWQELRGDPQAVAAYSVDVARHAVTEAHSAVGEIQQATIRATVPIDHQLPLQLQVPIDQNTTVTTVAPIPLSVPAQITFPAGGGTLNATVSLDLPVGTQLPVHLGLNVPVTTTVPVRLDVPVNIPLRETELAAPFERLRRLLEPAAQFFSGGQ